MANPYVGEIRLFAGNFAPQGWALCQGQLLSIAENEVLFNLIGTTYGGDGISVFALPDLRGRVPVHVGSGPGLSTRQLGESGGSETVALAAAQLPQHRHHARASRNDANTSAGPVDVLGKASSRLYGSGVADIAMAPRLVTVVGGGQAHNNMAPYLGLNFIISLFGIYPPQF